MSLLKKVIKAFKKLFKAPARKPRRAPKRRRLKAKKAASKAVKPPKRTVKRPPSKVTPKPKIKAVKASAPTPIPVPPKAVTQVKVSKAKVKPVGLLIGEVTHYFDRIKVCVIRIDHDHIKKGDRLSIKGPKGEVFQNVSSMQIENEDVTSAKKGQMIGLKVAKPVFVNDEVFRV